MWCLCDNPLLFITACNRWCTRAIIGLVNCLLLLLLVCLNTSGIFHYMMQCHFTHQHPVRQLYNRSSWFIFEWNFYLFCFIVMLHKQHNPAMAISYNSLMHKITVRYLTISKQFGVKSLTSIQQYSETCAIRGQPEASRISRLVFHYTKGP